MIVCDHGEIMAGNSRQRVPGLIFFERVAWQTTQKTQGVRARSARHRLAAPFVFALAIGCRQRSKDRQHGVEVGQSRTESVNEVAQGKVALEQVFVVFFHVIPELVHEGCVNLLELAQGLLAG